LILGASEQAPWDDTERSSIAVDPPAATTMRRQRRERAGMADNVKEYRYQPPTRSAARAAAGARRLDAA
jgi:hypothetical protein